VCDLLYRTYLLCYAWRIRQPGEIRPITATAMATTVTVTVAVTMAVAITLYLTNSHRSALTWYLPGKTQPRVSPARVSSNAPR
jgi:hypothetical protein